MNRWMLGTVVGALGLVACTQTTNAGYGRGEDHAFVSDDLVGQFVVPPDRATTGVSLVADGPDAVSASAELARRLGTLQQATQGLCTVEVADATPAYARTKAASGLMGETQDRWQTRASLLVRVDLSTAPDPMARLRAVEQCAEAVRTHLPKEQGGGAWSEGHVSAVTLEVIDPQQHAPALLARAQQRLSAVSVSTTEQWHPEDWRCTSDGQVHVGKRSYSGIALSLDTECRVVTTPPTPPPVG